MGLVGGVLRMGLWLVGSISVVNCTGMGGWGWQGGVYSMGSFSGKVLMGMESITCPLSGRSLKGFSKVAC